MTTTDAGGPRTGSTPDVIVVGAGMAGLTCASILARAGRCVQVVEKSAHSGGSAAMSGGMVWTLNNAAALYELCPSADPALQKVVVDELEPLLDWIAGRGVPVAPMEDVLGYGRGSRVDLVRYFEACVDMVQRSGGSLHTLSQCYELERTGDGQWSVSYSERGRQVSAVAPWVVLCAGGFHANPDLLREYVTENSCDVLVRGNRASAGDTLLAAQAVGADITASMSGFYGHLMAWPVDWQPGIFVLAGQYHSGRGALLDVDGVLIPDAVGSPDHVNAQLVAGRSGARAVLVTDERVRRDRYVPSASSPQHDRVKTAIDLGARVASSPDPEGIRAIVHAWGFADADVATALDQFNRIAPGRGVAELVNPPFYAMEVRSGITHTHGGLRVDEACRVQQRGGGVLPGLLAAGADAGGFFDVGYGGGLAAAGGLGRRAALTILGG